MTTTDLRSRVGAYRRTARAMRRHRHVATATRQEWAALGAIRAQAWQQVADTDPVLARLLIAEDLLLGRICDRKHRGRGHRVLDTLLDITRYRIQYVARRACP